MTPEQEAQAAAALKAEELAQQQASQRLAAELAAVAAVLIGRASCRERVCSTV